MMTSSEENFKRENARNFNVLHRLYLSNASKLYETPVISLWIFNDRKITHSLLSSDHSRKVTHNHVIKPPLISLSDHQLASLGSH